MHSRPLVNLHIHCQGLGDGALVLPSLDACDNNFSELNLGHGSWLMFILERKEGKGCELKLRQP